MFGRQLSEGRDTLVSAGLLVLLIARSDKRGPKQLGVDYIPICAHGFLAASGGSSKKPFSSLAASTVTSLPCIIPLFICEERVEGRRELTLGEREREGVLTEVCVCVCIHVGSPLF